MANATDHTRAHPSPLVILAMCWIVGVCLGQALANAKLWFVVACCTVLAAMAAMAMRRPAALRSWVKLASVAVAAAWTVVWQYHVPSHSIARFATAEWQLAQVTGVVESQPALVWSQKEPFGRFSHQPPATTFVLRAESIVVDGVSQSTGGRLLAKIHQADHSLRYGDRVLVTGWLGPLHRPANPGQPDYRRDLKNRGIHGRIRLPTQSNCRLLGRDAGSLLQRWRQRVWQSTQSSLRRGMRHNPEQLAFLATVLLGHRTTELEPLDDQFRRVGLAHLLAVSGAHLAILLGLVWLVARCVVSHPPYVALVVLMALGLYLLAVPLRVPIVRAAIMAALVCIGYALDRPIRGLDLLSLAAVLVLIWRPADLFSAGFQLSFGVVTGLLLYAAPVSRWLWSACCPQAVHKHAPWLSLTRWCVNYVSASTVAYLVALPLVAYHFRMVSPLGVVMTLAALPVVTAVLAVGYVKIVLGWMLPSVGLLLAAPLQSLAQATTSWVGHVSGWRISSIQLSNQPTVTWTFTALAVVTALLGGWFGGRRLALATAASLCVVAALDTPLKRSSTGDFRYRNQNPAMTLRMLSVGHGSCYLVTLHTSHHRRDMTGEETGGWMKQTKDHVLMFDCGSQGYTDVGTRRVVPALGALAVRHIDTLFISHADLDHFNGSLAVIDHVGVGRVLMPPQMVSLAQRKPHSPPGIFLVALQQRGVRYKAISQGWRQIHGRAQLETLWPPAGMAHTAANDTSLVLSITTAGRRLILNGDIQQLSIRRLMDTGANLDADVCDLPHHGSIVAASGQWLDAVNPLVLLQSSGPSRSRIDKWAALLNESPIRRLVSHHTGMVHLAIGYDGKITWTTFKDPHLWRGSFF